MVNNISEITGIVQGAFGKAVSLKVTSPAPISVLPGM